MTTVAYTKDNTSDSIILMQSPGGNNARIYTGPVFERNTVGGDRAPGSFPGFIRVPIFYTRKALLRSERVKVEMGSGSSARSVYQKRTVVVRPSAQLVKYVWKRGPDGPLYEPDHPYSGFRVTSSGTSISVNVNGTPSGWSAYRPYQLHTTAKQVVDDWNANETNLLIGKLRNEIAGSSFNAAVSLGEAPMALSMIAEHATRIARAFSAVRKGNLVSATKLLVDTNPRLSTRARSRRPSFSKDVSGNWLALQYGWYPLVSDIHAGMVFVDHQMRNPAVRTYRVRRYFQGSRAGKALSLSFGAGTFASLPCRVISSCDIIARIEEKSVARLSGLLDPASVAWELLPYSFVVDWFIPIGNYLSARGLADSLKGSFVTSRRFVVRRSSDPTSTKPIHPVYNGKSISLTYTKVTRTVSTSISVPLPTITPLSQAFSWRRAANAVALLTQSNR